MPSRIFHRITVLLSHQAVEAMLASMLLHDFMSSLNHAYTLHALQDDRRQYVHYAGILSAAMSHFEANQEGSVPLA